MHSFPLVLVRAEDKKHAKQVCESWINDHIEGSPFDYGGPADDADDPECKTVLRYGEPGFLEAIRSCIEVEKDTIREHWEVAKQLVLKFAACKDAPADGLKFMVTRTVAQGIAGLCDPGKEVEYEASVYEGYMAMHALYEMKKQMNWRGYMRTHDACLFVAEDTVDVEELLAGAARVSHPEELFLVRTDCHH